MSPFFDRDGVTIFNGDCREVLKSLPDCSVNCCVTSPPYWGLRDYGHDAQLGLEKTPEDYVAELVAVFREVRRVLADDGTLWLNIGDSYARAPEKGGSGPNGKHDFIPDYGNARKIMADSSKAGSSDDAVGRGDRPGTRAIAVGLKPKDLVGIPWRVAFALQADGWWLRQDIIWSKPNPMPESVTDRCTKAHEYIFLLSKRERYHYNAEAVRLPPSGITGGTVFGGYRKGAALREQGIRVAGRECTKEDRDRYAEAGANLRSVWTVVTKPYSGAHFATFPPALIEPCIRAGCPDGGVVLDPFLGSGTTAEVAQRQGCRCVGIELNADYARLAAKRFRQRTLLPVSG